MTNLSVARRPRARVIVGAVIAAAVTAAGVGLMLAPWPTLERAPAAITAAPPAAASVASCSGPLLGAGRASGAAGALADAAPSSIVSGASNGALPTSEALMPADVNGGAGPAAVTAEPVDGALTELAAAGSAQVSDPDLSGFAASVCTRSSMESWLVGGSAATGAADLVVLANPGDVAARVTLTVYGADGRATPAAGADLRIAARSQRVVPLAALALGEASPVVQVTSAEAPVRASLQSSITRVLLPGGVDQGGTSVAPTPELLIPGVQIASAPGAASTSAFVRLLSPDAATTAAVAVWGEAGPVGDAQSVELTAGVPLELDLTGLPVGAYTVRVAADAPLTGAVWSTTGIDEGADFAWFAAAESLTAPALVAVANGPTPTLTLASPSDADQVVQLIAGAGTGAAEEVAVPAGRSVTVAVRAAEVYRVVPGDGGVTAAIAYSGAGQIAGYAVPAGDVAAASIEVYPR